MLVEDNKGKELDSVSKTGIDSGKEKDIYLEVDINSKKINELTFKIVNVELESKRKARKIFDIKVVEDTGAVITAPIESYGNLEYNDDIYKLQIPNMIGNEDFDDILKTNGWSNVPNSKDKTSYKFDFWKFIGGVNAVNDVEMQLSDKRSIKIMQGLAAYSLGIGMLNSAVESTSYNRVKAYFDKSGKQKKAVIVLEMDKLSSKELAGKKFRIMQEAVKNINRDRETLNLEAVKLYQNYLRKTYNLPKKLGVVYDIEFSVDKNHKYDPGVGFIYKVGKNYI